jgi:hypothetical protein
MPKRDYSLLDFAEDVLKTSDKPLQYNEIWETGKTKDFFIKLQLKGKTPWQSLGALIFVDVRDNENSRFLKIGKNPARFFLKSREQELTSDIITNLQKEEIKSEHTEIKKIGFDERDLHPVLSYFAYTNIDFNKSKAIFTRTIYHENSKKGIGLNQWIHPDIVGFYIPIEEWNETIFKLSKNLNSNTIKFYSFELKKRIDKSNYREYFFQAVSNSSWANEGYLVASDIKQDDDLISELERLSMSFGIGIIQLDLEDIDSSKVIYPARYKENLDWELMNKLCDQNPDFEKFLENVKIDYEGGKIHKHEYDKIMDIDEVEDYIKKKLIK